MHTEYMKGFLLTALGVIVLSFDALLIRFIEVHSFSLLFWRGLLLSLMVFIWCRLRHSSQPLFRLDAPSLRSALLFFISSACFVSAINLTSVANVLVIISAQPLFAALLARREIPADHLDRDCHLHAGDRLGTERLLAGA